MQMAQPLRVGVSAWLRGTDYAPTGTASLALSTADPTYDVSSIAEPSGGGYARQPATFDSPITVSNVRAANSNAPLVFNATATWGTITHGALYRGTTALWQGAFNAQKLIDTGNSLSLSAGSLQITAGANWSDYSRDLILNVTSAGSMTAPAQLYVSLSTADPLSDGSGLVEPSGSYSRQAFTFTETSNTSAGIIVGNAASMVFGPATTNWGNISHMAIYDAVVGGNLIAFGPVAVQRNIVIGDAYALAINSLSLTIR